VCLFPTKAAHLPLTTSARQPGALCRRHYPLPRHPIVPILIAATADFGPRHKSVASTKVGIGPRQSIPTSLPAPRLAALPRRAALPHVPVQGSLHDTIALHSRRSSGSSLPRVAPIQIHATRAVPVCPSQHLVCRVIPKAACPPMAERLLTNINTIYHPGTRVVPPPRYTTSTSYPRDAHCLPKSRHTTLHPTSYWQ
jgi:hypothetical protein